MLRAQFMAQVFNLERLIQCKKFQFSFTGKNGIGLKIHDTAKHKENPIQQEKPMMQRFTRKTK